MRITEGALVPVACLEHDPVECARAQDCITLDFWRGLYDVVNQYVDSVTLEELVNRGQGAGFFHLKIKNAGRTSGVFFLQKRCSCAVQQFF